MYLDTFRKILREGKWVSNERTGTRCLTIPRHVYEIELKPETCPLLSVRPSYPVSAIAEMVGYMRQYEWSQQFANIGTRSWEVNSSSTKDWITNPTRKGEGHIGKCYGAAVPKESIHKVWETIQSGNDDRRCVLNWWQPDKFSESVLAPCLDRHNFTLTDDEVFLTSTQRSCDAACGWNYNSLSIYFLGMMAAHLSGKEGGTALHVINNLHIYEGHIEGIEEMLSRKPVEFDSEFWIKDEVTSWEDWIKSDCHTREIFTLEGYKGVAQPKIDFELVA
jgi:thymidylate synthase